jgi:steroid delta-isomerase
VDKNTPAIQAHKASIANAMAGNKAQWLEVFADDAVLQDPVGPSPFDPEGNGFKGRERVEEFWDLMIGPSNLTIVPHKRICCGDNIVAVNMTITNDMGEMKSVVEMVVIYETNEAGKLNSLRAYWDLEALMEQLSG